MAHDENTSRRIASNASRGLRNPASLTLEEIREICGSVLTQAPDRNPPKNAMGLLPRNALAGSILEDVSADSILAQYSPDNAMWGSLSPPGAHKLYK